MLNVIMIQLLIMKEICKIISNSFNRINRGIVSKSVLTAYDTYFILCKAF